MMSNKILTGDEFPFLFEDYDGERYDVHHVYRDTNRLIQFHSSVFIVIYVIH